MTNPKHTSSDRVERLQEIALGYLAECNKAADRIEALEAEVERLREQLRLANIDALNELAENERLREALELIRDPDNVYYAGEMRAFARAALEARHD